MSKDVLIVPSSGDVRFYEFAASGTNYVGFRAPDSIPSDRIWVLPSSDGVSNQLLATDGTGTLFWKTDSTSAAGSGVSLGLDDTQNISHYLLFASTSGNDIVPEVSTKLTFNPSTSELNVGGSGLFASGAYVNNIITPATGVIIGPNISINDSLFVDVGGYYPDSEGGASGVIFIGNYAGSNVSNSRGTIAIGGESLLSGIKNTKSVFIGRQAGYRASGMPYTVAVGDVVLKNVINAHEGGGDIGFTTAIGYAAGSDSYIYNRGSTYVGGAAGNRIFDKGFSTFIGTAAGQYASGVYWGTFIGLYAGAYYGGGGYAYSMKNSEYSIGVGVMAAAKSAGFNYSIAIGGSAALEASGSRNLYLGNYAGSYASGNYNIELLTSGTSYLSYTTLSNKLHINHVIAGDWVDKKIAIGNITSANLSPNATLEVLPKATVDTGLIIKSPTSSTADFQQWQNSAGTALARIDAAGSISGVASGIFGQNLQVLNIPNGATETDIIFIKSDGVFVKRPLSSVSVSGISNEQSIINALIFG